MTDEPKVLWLGPEEGPQELHWVKDGNYWSQYVQMADHNKNACAAKKGACAWKRVPSQGRHVPDDHKLCQGEIQDHDWVRYDAEMTWLWTCKLCGATSGNPPIEPEPYPPCLFCFARGHSLQECKLYQGSKTAEDPSRIISRLASGHAEKFNISYGKAADYVLATHPELAKARKEFIAEAEAEKWKQEADEIKHWRERAEKAEAMSASIRSMCDAQNEAVRKRAEDAEAAYKKSAARVVELEAVISGFRSWGAMQKWFSARE